MSNGGVNHLDEVKDPVSKAKLEGIQQSSQLIDRQIIEARKSLGSSSAMATATDLIAKRLMQECAPIKTAVEADKMDTSEAKIRIDVIKSNADIVRGILEDSRKDIATQTGVIKGLQLAQKTTEDSFNAEALKYERWERIQAEEEEASKAAEPVETSPATKKKKTKSKVRRKVR